ncbi:hypothetical protein [Poseidonibacter ostreae]|jgi:ribosomal protein L18E|uniref:Uncharacterized protein n=1 Tax=Poseidonibacter ostreae TaxID=2654171 RepID=A0A6L4WVE5_9BACT|nr:hypothetical protein [Poseidonibacter ostreae]KAB7886827.1 hypothetical protein GA417_04505 [Poseidonibacter ostreae]KAB7888749.1 hypothetical protein GBG18_12460 [Poseidonibacter ostreae]KAB7890470.1 hypothetical protein GBG19_03145 [Poseidonibacter ostreae]MAC82846.1 hypothetical protein [Arcobacter sp.]|tara:strand:+ start:7947 stop:8315 length:369 start_codon:yes stop_codon:yes gene_type:complete
MGTNIDIKQLENQVVECYSYFMHNHKTSNFDNLENMLTKLQKSMNLLTMTNIVNIIDRVIEDGRKNSSNKNKQYNVSSIQTTKDNKIYLVCHEVLGFDDIDKKFILDNVLSYIDFVDIKKIY